MDTTTDLASALRPAAARGSREARSVLALAVPIVAGLTLSALMGVVDSAVVGALGSVPLAAVSLTSSVMLVFVAGLYGFLSPIGILAARAFGAGAADGVAAQRRAGFRVASVAGLVCAALMAALLPLLPYLGQAPDVVEALPAYWLLSAASLVPFALLLVDKQLLDAIDRPWLGVGVAGAIVVANAGLSAWLVHGGIGIAGLGLAGAGIGTFLAYFVGVLAQRTLVRLRGIHRWLAATRAPWRDAAQAQRREGTPMGTQYLLETGATALAGVIVGVFGATALAANQITMSVTMTLYMAPLGMAAAVGLRLSQAIGAGDADSLWPIAKAGLLMVSAWMGGFSVLLATAGPLIAAGFTHDAAVIAGAGSLFFAVALMQVADGVQSVSLGALRGLLDSAWPTRVSLVCYWGVALPLGWMLAIPAGFGPAGVWIGFGIGLCVAAVALTTRLKRRTSIDRR